MRKRLATLLSVMLAFSTLLSALTAPISVQAAPTTSSEQAKPAATFKDVETHWAKEKIMEWSVQNIISGITEDTFMPDQEMTRAQWATIVNRMFQLQEQKPQTYTDVQATAWYANAVNTATTAGYMKGYTDGTFKPNATLTRQEAIASLSRLLKWETNNTKPTWKDSADIEAWAASAVAEAVNKGIVKGYKDDTFKPNKSLTRAEAVSMLDRAFDTYGVWYGQAGTYGPASNTEVVKGAVIVNVPDVTLQNLHIKGDHILTEGVGEGDVNLNKVRVDGKTLIYGGGKNSIHVNDSVLLNVIVDKRDGSIRLVAKGTSTIQEIVLQSPTAIEAHKGVDVSRVRLSEELPAQSDIRLNGYFNTVEVEAYSIKLQVPQGSIKQLNVNEKAKGTTIEASKEAEILSLVLDAAVKVVGEVVVKQATINAEGASFDKAPEQLKVGDKITKDVKVTVGGKEQTAEQATGQQPTTGEGSNGGSSNGSSSGSSGGGSNSGGSTGGGTSDGGSNSGNGSNITIELRESVVTVGEAVYGKSLGGVKAYLLPEEVASNNFEMIQIALEKKIARQADIQADGTFVIPTDGFDKYRYYIFVFDQANKFKAGKPVMILDDLSKPFHTISLGHFFTPKDKLETIQFDFNRKIQLVPGKDIHQSVLVATYEEPNYKPLGADYQVTIQDNYVSITSLKSIIGKKISFKILDGTFFISDKGEVNEEINSFELNPLQRIQIADPTININAVKKGTRIPFTLSNVHLMDAEVYLVNQFVSGRVSDYDRLVENGWANKVVVSKDAASGVHYMDTSNLPAGNYRLLAYGDYILIKIVE